MNPEVKRGPFTNEEEAVIFRTQKNHGNKWSAIARLLKGRTDNDIKNYFYSTLRRQLRKILRDIKGDQNAEPEEITFRYLQRVLKENNVSYDLVDNENIRNLLIHSDKSAAKTSSAQKTPAPPEIAPHPSTNYSLYRLSLRVEGSQ